MNVTEGASRFLAIQHHRTARTTTCYLFENPGRPSTAIAAANYYFHCCYCYYYHHHHHHHHHYYYYYYYYHYYYCYSYTTTLHRTTAPSLLPPGPSPPPSLSLSVSLFPQELRSPPVGLQSVCFTLRLRRSSYAGVRCARTRWYVGEVSSCFVSSRTTALGSSYRANYQCFWDCL